MERRTFLLASVLANSACAIFSPDLSDVKKDPSLGQRYLDSFMDIPEIKAAVEEGKLGKLWYNPEPAELERVLRRTYLEFGMNINPTKEVQHYAENRTVESGEAVISPATFNSFGKGLTTEIVFKRGFFETSRVNSDEDVKSAIYGQLKTLKDYFEGFSVGDENLDYSAIANGHVNYKNVLDLLLVRSLHEELAKAAEGRPSTNLAISEGRLNALGMDYINVWERLGAQTSDVCKNQLEELADIKPVANGDKITLYFRKHGNHYNIKKVEPRIQI